MNNDKNKELENTEEFVPETENEQNSVVSDDNGQPDSAVSGEPDNEAEKIDRLNEESDEGNSKKKAKKDKTEKTPKKAVSKRKLKHGSLSIVITCVVIAFAIVLNIVMSLLSDRFAFMNADLTSSQIFNLTDESVTLAQSVEDEVKLTFLTDKQTYQSMSSTNTYYAQVLSIAEQYKKYNSKISTEFISLVDNPNFANKYKNETLRSSNIIVSCGDKYRVLNEYDLFNIASYDSYSYIASSKAEQAFDTAILAVTNKQTANITLVTDNCDTNFDYFKNLLTQNNYNITEISIEKQDVPKNTDLLILLAPKSDYSPDAINRLLNYLNDLNTTNKTMLYIPTPETAKTPNIDALLAEWGLGVGDGLVFEQDTSSIYGNNIYDGVACYLGANDFTEGLDENAAPIIASYARPVTIDKKYTTVTLLQFSDKSGICPSDADESFDFNAAATGSVPIAAYSVISIDSDSKDDNSANNVSTVMVFGSSTMFEESILSSGYSDSKYILTMISDATGLEQNGVTIEAKSITEYDLNIDSKTSTFTGIALYVFIPVAVLTVGMIVFLKRRLR